jgi:hypothetical protein
LYRFSHSQGFDYITGFYAKYCRKNLQIRPEFSNESTSFLQEPITKNKL